MGEPGGEVEKKKIWIVIPAYQAEKTLAAVFSRIPQSLGSKSVTVLVVNDGSTDDTRQVIEQIRPGFFLPVEAIHKEANAGYGAALKTGLKWALERGADITAVVHADGQYAPELLPQLLAPLENGEADLVIGSRMHGLTALRGGMPLYKFVANRVLTFIENTVFGLNVSEYHSGYLAHSARFLGSFDFGRLSNTFHFDGELIMMSGIKKARLKDIPIPTHYGDEVSHLNPITYGFDVLSTVSRYLMGRYHF